MSIRIKAERTTGRELRPGELFSSIGPEYWDQFPRFTSIGERVYLRTGTPANGESGQDDVVYRITIIDDDDTDIIG